MDTLKKRILNRSPLMINHFQKSIDFKIISIINLKINQNKETNEISTFVLIAWDFGMRMVPNSDKRNFDIDNEGEPNFYTVSWVKKILT